MSFFILSIKKVEKMSLLIEIVKILIDNDIFEILLVNKTKLKKTCFLLMNPHNSEPFPWTIKAPFCVTLTFVDHFIYLFSSFVVSKAW
jgi:hypothetical protein